MSLELFDRLERLDVEKDQSIILAALTCDGHICLFNAFRTTSYKAKLMSKEFFQKLVQEQLWHNWSPEFAFNISIYYDLMRRRKCEDHWHSNKLATVMQVV